MLVDKGILGGRGEEVFLVIEKVVVLEGGNVGEELKIIGRGRRDRGAGDGIFWRGRDVRVVTKGKSGPDGRDGWGEDSGLGFGWDEDWGVEGRVVKDRRGRAGSYKDGGQGSICVSIRTWEIPSIEVAIQYLKNSSSSVSEILLIDVVNGGLGGDGDL